MPSDPNLITISKQHLDGTRIFQETGFEPKISFHQGLATTARFYQWYFANIAPAQCRTSNVDAPADEQKHKRPFDGGFHTVITDDGLPISV